MDRRRLAHSLLQDVSQCLMRLVAATTTADAIEALTGFLQGLPLTWHTVNVFADGELGRRVVSQRCPRGFAPFLVRTGFLKRHVGTYQGTFADSTIVLVKAASPSSIESGMACAAGFARGSSLNDGTVTACIGALIHEALTRIVCFESDARRRLTLTGYAAQNDDLIAVFDVRGHLVEQYPDATRTTMPSGFFQTVTAPSLRKRSLPSCPVVMSEDGRVYDVKMRWVVSDPLLDSRYLVVHARTRQTAPLAVVERLKSYGLSPRESQVAGLVFSGHTNRLIAEALFISRDTVKTHCKHIFGKLGISRRTEFLRVIEES